MDRFNKAARSGRPMKRTPLRVSSLIVRKWLQVDLTEEMVSLTSVAFDQEVLLLINDHVAGLNEG